VRWLARLGLLVGGLVMGLVLAEGLARVVKPAGADLLFAAAELAPPDMFTVHPKHGHVPTPNWSGRLRALGFDVEVSYDAHSIRNGVAARDGVRWLAVGDSFTAAVQVDHADTFVGLLDGDPGRQVLNAGVDNFSTWQASLRYQELDDALAADGVLLTFFTGNDFTDNLTRSFPPYRAGPGVPPTIRWLMEQSYLYGQWRVLKRRKELATVAVGDRYRWQLELSLFHSEGAKRLAALGAISGEALEELAAAARQRGDRLLVALAPPSFAVEESRAGGTFEMVDLDPSGAQLDGPRQTALEILHRAGIDTCDLEAALEAGDGTYLVFDGHWSAEGHRVVADALRACMEAPPGSLVPPSTGASIGGRLPGPGSAPGVPAQPPPPM